MAGQMQRCLAVALVPFWVACDRRKVPGYQTSNLQRQGALAGRPARRPAVDSSRIAGFSESLFRDLGSGQVYNSAEIGPESRTIT